MSTLSAEQRSNNIIAYGRVMVKIVESADYLYLGTQRLEQLTLEVVRGLYRRRLRELIALVSADIGAEILAASRILPGWSVM